MRQDTLERGNIQQETLGASATEGLDIWFRTHDTLECWPESVSIDRVSNLKQHSNSQSLSTH